MKKTVLIFIAFLGFSLAASAQEKPKKNRPVTQKESTQPATSKAEPTAEGQRNKQKTEEEIKKRRAENRAKMEQAKKGIRDKIASDTTATK